MTQRFPEFHSNRSAFETSLRFLGKSFEISPAEIILIRLGALLHDISHLPFSHDLEIKTHKIFYGPEKGSMNLQSYYGHYNKHDAYAKNPLLYLLLCDRHKSVLANLLTCETRVSPIIPIQKFLLAVIQFFEIVARLQSIVS